MPSLPRRSTQYQYSWMPASLCRHELCFFVWVVGITLPTRTMYLILLEEHEAVAAAAVTIAIVLNTSSSILKIGFRLIYLFLFLLILFRTIFLWTAFHSVPPGVDDSNRDEATEVQTNFVSSQNHTTIITTKSKINNKNSSIPALLVILITTKPY